MKRLTFKIENKYYVVELKKIAELAICPLKTMPTKKDDLRHLPADYSNKYKLFITKTLDWASGRKIYHWSTDVSDHTFSRSRTDYWSWKFDEAELWRIFRRAFLTSTPLHSDLVHSEPGGKTKSWTIKNIGWFSSIFMRPGFEVSIFTLITHWYSTHFGTTPFNLWIFLIELSYIFWKKNFWKKLELCFCKYTWKIFIFRNI